MLEYSSCATPGGIERVLTTKDDMKNAIKRGVHSKKRASRWSRASKNAASLSAAVRESSSASVAGERVKSFVDYPAKTGKRKMCLKTFQDVAETTWGLWKAASSIIASIPLGDERDVQGMAHIERLCSHVTAVVDQLLSAKGRDGKRISSAQPSSLEDLANQMRADATRVLACAEQLTIDLQGLCV